MHNQCKHICYCIHGYAAGHINSKRMGLCGNCAASFFGGDSRAAKMASGYRRSCWANENVCYISCTHCTTRCTKFFILRKAATTSHSCCIGLISNSVRLFTRLHSLTAHPHRHPHCSCCSCCSCCHCCWSTRLLRVHIHNKPSQHVVGCSACRQQMRAGREQGYSHGTS